MLFVIVQCSLYTVHTLRSHPSFVVSRHNIVKRTTFRSSNSISVHRGHHYAAIVLALRSMFNVFIFGMWKTLKIFAHPNTDPKMFGFVFVCECWRGMQMCKCCGFNFASSIIIIILMLLKYSIHTVRIWNECWTKWKFIILLSFALCSYLISDANLHLKTIFNLRSIAYCSSKNLIRFYRFVFGNH